MFRKSIIAAALALGIGSAGAAGASDLYGATYTGSLSDLFSIDQTTGAATLIGATGKNIGDMTNVGGSLVGIDLSTNTLWTLDAATGAASGGLAVTGTRGTITSIAWDPTTQQLFGNTTNGFSGSDILYTIDTVTGAATTVGNLGVTNLYGLGFGQDGSLFASDTGGTLYGVNTATGAAGAIGASGFFSLFDLASRPEDNVLFATPDLNNLLTLNKATGAGALVGGLGGSFNMAGLAFLGAPVPEPGAWALMIGGFALAGMALRRRRSLALAAA
jgi:hypothetical protein